MADIISIIRAVIQQEMEALRFGELAVVTAVYAHAQGDTHNYECDVKLREGELELHKVPIATPHIGMASTPNVNDLVLLIYVNGDANLPVVAGRLYSNQKNPPVHAEKEWRVESPLQGASSIAITSDEWIEIKAGETTLTLKKDDDIEIKGGGALTIEVKGDVEIKCVDCTIDASGTINIGKNGGGVITDQSHKCYLTGAPHVGSITVKAKM